MFRHLASAVGLPSKPSAYSCCPDGAIYPVCYRLLLTDCLSDLDLRGVEGKSSFLPECRRFGFSRCVQPDFREWPNERGDKSVKNSNLVKYKIIFVCFQERLSGLHALLIKIHILILLSKYADWALGQQIWIFYGLIFMKSDNPRRNSPRSRV
jgi:hypothetical protein